MQRQRREDRKPDHDPDPDQREPRQVAPAGSGSRRTVSRIAGEHRGDERPPEPDERRVEILDRQPRRRQRERERRARPRTPHARARRARIASRALRRRPRRRHAARLRHRRRAVALLASSMPNSNTAAIVTALEAVVEAGAPGDRLPSVRELMARHRAGPATVQRAIATLAARGLVEARPGRGTFVAARAAPAVADPSWQTVALARGRSTPTRSRRCCARPRPTRSCSRAATCRRTCSRPRALAAALARAARRPGAWDRVPLEGIGGLRSFFAAAVGAAPGDVLICPGGQAGLAACLRGLAAPGAPVVVEAPTYLGALTAARAQGLVPVPVPADARGVRPDLLADALERSGARLVYLQPIHANPHGATLAPERRADVLEAVRAANAFLIEDDAFRDLELRPGAAAAVHRGPGRPRRARPLAHQAGGARAADRRRRRARAGARAAARRADRRGPLRRRARCRRQRSSWSARPRGARTCARLRRVLRERRDALAAAWGERVRGCRRAG